MPRLPRVIVPGVAHHVTQRGNRRQRTFFNGSDYRAYLAYLGRWSREFAVEILCYCLMPNHVHLIAVPHDATGLTRCMAEVHRRYTLRVNEREGWKGYLWQGRFFSCPMDDEHLLAALRYVLLNPLRTPTPLVTQAEEWPYSSARCHIEGVGDGVVDPTALAGMVPDWRALLVEDDDGKAREELRRHARTGRPLGSEAFVERIEGAIGRSLKVRPRGRPRGVAAA